MTTIVTIKNEGPELVELSFYNVERSFKEERVWLAPGETHQVTVWDGHIPVVTAHRHRPSTEPKQFFAIPPAGFAS